MKSAQRGGSENGGGDGPLFVRRALSSSSKRSTTKQRAHLILFSTCVDISQVLNTVVFFPFIKCDKIYEYKQ